MERIISKDKSKELKKFILRFVAENELTVNNVIEVTFEVIEYLHGNAILHEKAQQ